MRRASGSASCAGVGGRIARFSLAAILQQGMRYKVALRQSEEGFSVSCPGLPGCWSQVATEQEALANIQEAIREYLEAAADLNKDAEIREVEVTV